MSVLLMYIRLSTPLIILGLPKPVSEFTYVTASSSFTSTIDGQVLTPKSTNYVIKVVCLYWDTIAIGNTSFRYELIWSQLSTNGFVSPRASESALSYTHRVHNGLMMAANYRTLYLTTLYWSQIYIILQLSCFAIYWMESIPHHSGHINPKSSTWPDQEGVVGIRVDFYKSIRSTKLRYIDHWFPTYLLYNSAYIEMSYALMLMTPHLPRNNPLEHEWIVICSATRNKVSCREEVTINNRDPTTIIDPEIIHISSAVGQIAVVDLLMWRSGNGDVTNWWTNLEGTSNTEIWVTIRDSGSSIHTRIIEWSRMIPEIYL